MSVGEPDLLCVAVRVLAYSEIVHTASIQGNIVGRVG